MTMVESDRARLRSSLEETEALHDKTKAEAARELAEVRNALETELTALRGELQQKAWSLAQQQASVENLAQVHREQIRKLEARLAEQQPVTEQQTSRAGASPQSRQLLAAAGRRAPVPSCGKPRLPALAKSNRFARNTPLGWTAPTPCWPPSRRSWPRAARYGPTSRKACAPRSPASITKCNRARRRCKAVRMNSTASARK